MKNFYVIMLMALLMAVPMQSMAQRHRHHAGVTATQSTQPKDTASQGITAYSDTTSVDTADVDTAYTQSSYNDDDNNDADDFNNFMGHFSTHGPEVAIVFIALFFIFGLPVLAIVFIVYLVYRNRRRKYQLAQEALAAGRPIPNEVKTKIPVHTETDLWQRGVKNLFLGIGLAVCFAILGSDSLIGIGLLVFFYGMGQMVIAKTSKQNPSTNNNDGSQPVNHYQPTDNNTTVNGPQPGNQTVADDTQTQTGDSQPADGQSEQEEENTEVNK